MRFRMDIEAILQECLQKDKVFFSATMQDQLWTWTRKVSNQFLKISRLPKKELTVILYHKSIMEVKKQPENGLDGTSDDCYSMH